MQKIDNEVMYFLHIDSVTNISKMLFETCYKLKKMNIPVKKNGQWWKRGIFFQQEIQITVTFARLH